MVDLRNGHLVHHQATSLGIEDRCFMTISRQRLHKIEAIRDKDIDYYDIPTTDAAFSAVRNSAYLRPKRVCLSASGSGHIEMTQGTGAGLPRPASTLFCGPIWRRTNCRRDHQRPDAAQNMRRSFLLARYHGCNKASMSRIPGSTLTTLIPSGIGR